MRIQRKTLCLLIVLGLSYSVSAQAQSLLDAAQSALAHDARWQAQTLATLRDTLLPRLISGQLRLPEAQAATEAALGGALQT